MNLTSQKLQTSSKASPQITVPLNLSRFAMPRATKSQVNTVRNVTADFEKRAKIYHHGCKYLDKIEQLMKNAQLDELLDFHTKIYNLEVPMVTDQKDCQYVHHNMTSIRFLDNYSIAMCLPPKCGTTNWQKSLIALEKHIPMEEIEKISAGPIFSWKSAFASLLILFDFVVYLRNLADLLNIFGSLFNN